MTVIASFQGLATYDCSNQPDVKVAFWIGLQTCEQSILPVVLQTWAMKLQNMLDGFLIVIPRYD